MLASILPGFREVRVPLAAGYISLLALYVAIGREPSFYVDQTGVLKLISSLFADLGTGPSLAAITFAAYISGAVVEGVAKAISNILTSLWAMIKFSRSRFIPTSRLSTFWNLVLTKTFDVVQADDAISRTYKDIATKNEKALAEIGYKATVTAIVCVQVEFYVGRLEEDFNNVPARLMGKDPELWSAWDRARSESEFRLAVGFSGALLTGALVYQSGPLAAAGFLVCMGLLAQAGTKQREAVSILTEALEAGRISSPVLDDFGTAERIAWRRFESKQQALAFVHGEPFAAIKPIDSRYFVESIA